MSNANVKIARFHKLGGPEVLKLDELPLPEPGKGEVRLRVHAVGLNRADVMFLQGQYLVTPNLPAKIGYEASGIVEAVGPDVDKSMIGKKYSTVPCFDISKYGVCGEIAIVPAFALATYPDNLSSTEGAAIWMQYLTAYGALIHFGQITKKDTVIITAASSSVGIAAIEIAAAEGATSIAVTRKARKKEELLAHGATHVIATEETDLLSEVKKITNGEGARIIFDPIAGPNVEILMQALAHQGTLFVYGNLSLQPTPFPLFSALRQGTTMRGYTLFEVVSVPALRAKAEKYVSDHLQNGVFKPTISRTFSLQSIQDAYRYMESNEQIGKIVVEV